MSHVTSSPTGRPLRADAMRNRLLILDAAREVFAARGLDVTLADVAEHANVGIGTVYRRFASKEELVDAVFESMFHELSEAATRALDEADPWTALTSFVEFACAHMAANRGLIAVMGGADQGCEQIRCERSRAEVAITEIFARNHAAGSLRADAEPTDLFALIYMVGAIAEFAQPVNPEVWRRYLCLILDGLRGPDHDRSVLPTAALTTQQLDDAKRLVRMRRA